MKTLESGNSFDRVIDNEGRIVPKLISELYRIQLEEVSALSGLRINALRRRDRSFVPKTQRRLREMMSVLARAETLAGGNPTRAYAWYRTTPIPSLGDITAEELVHRGDGDLVMEHLSHLAEGSYA
jgi:uncharacterized protein (DUF2384 family)